VSGQRSRFPVGGRAARSPDGLALGRIGQKAGVRFGENRFSENRAFRPDVSTHGEQEKVRRPYYGVAIGAKKKNL
ncbi:MAG: hypothetical protein K2V38_26685, partial [Gemmataceae bacterium]|nr:hypothetical protein [Gemmataceae bacterium]